MGIDWFPLWLSLRVAAISTVLAFVGGLALAYILANGNFRGRDILDALVTLPLVLPPTVLGYYLLVVLGRDTLLGRGYERVTGSPLVFTWQAAVVAALLHSAPLLIKTSRAALESVDHSYERACSGESRCRWHGDRSWRAPHCLLHVRWVISARRSWLQATFRDTRRPLP
jgi:molybdate transport system permease protein